MSIGEAATYYLLILPLFFGSISESVRAEEQGGFPSGKRPPEADVEEKPKETCLRHGGISCEVGPDDDGSVVCRDGYRDVKTRYRFYCSAAKLKITEAKNIGGRILVVLRNGGAVEAQSVRVFYRGGTGDKVEMRGSATIPPFGIQEYEATASNLTAGDDIETKLEIDCSNCQ